MKVGSESKTAKGGFGLLKEKVPLLQSPLKATIIFTIWVLLFLACLASFWWFDRLLWSGALISQSVAALILAVLGYAHIRNAPKYRRRYGKLAYQHFFFKFIIPIFAIYYACIFHPLLVGGIQLLPWWLAVLIGVVLFSIRPLIARHIHRSAFDEVGHGLGIYTVYPEEGASVSSEIYSYIRHPIYFGSFFAALGLAFLRNSLLAVGCALIFIIPIMIEAKLEDTEMTRRFGNSHLEYMKSTGALLPPIQKIGEFLKFLVTGK